MPGSSAASTSRERGPASANCANCSVTDTAWRAFQRQPGAPQEEPGDREDFGRWLRADPTFERWLAGVWPVLRALEVLAALRDGRVPLSQLGRGLFDPTDLDALAGAWGGSEPAGLTPLDAAIFDELGLDVDLPDLHADMTDEDAATGLVISGRWVLDVTIGVPR